MSPQKKNETMKIEACKILTEIGALKFGTFNLTSGKTSPYYVDLRLVASFPDVFQKICKFHINFIKEEIGRENFDRIAGVPLGGVPLASVISYQLKKPFIYIRKGARLHGREKKIEGILTPGDRVLLIDDLITTGISLKKAAEIIRSEGGITPFAVVTLNREEGGQKNLEKEGLTLYSLLKISDIADNLCEIGAITNEQLKTILKQIKKRKAN